MSNIHTKASNSTRSNTDNQVGPKLGTWKRLGPPNHAMDITKANGPILGPKHITEAKGLFLGPKHKAHMDEPHGGVFSDKKQRLLDEETKALGKLMADNLGSAVAAVQHRREQ